MYTWDAENRLTCVQSGDPNSPANGDKKVEFVYDYLGRRVEKKVSTHNGTSWSVSDCRRFVWSDWLLVLELDASDPNDVTILRKYTWGLDLAGQGGAQTSGLSSIDSAGGIGGLLATEDVEDTKDYYYLYDANGNVGQVLDASDGSIAAKYEYDAYGNNLLDPNDPNESGPYAADNPFRFSTKYWDDETGLGYWGYRYYTPRLGRWINRDSIEEAGGLHLYAYLANNAVNGVDLLGHQSPGAGPGGGLSGGASLSRALAKAKELINRLRNVDCKDAQAAMTAAEGAIRAYELLVETVTSAPKYRSRNLRQALGSLKRAIALRCGWKKPPKGCDKAAMIKCLTIHAGYKALSCKGCSYLGKSREDREEAGKRAACLAAEIAGRRLYLKNKCDKVFCQPEKEKGHRQALKDQERALQKCLKKAAG